MNSGNHPPTGGGPSIGPFASEESLLAQARERLAHELATLPPGPIIAVARWALARRDTAPPALSLGALVHCLRRAEREGNQAATRELFVGLLTRIEGLNRRWAWSVVERTPQLNISQRETVREELRQELTMYLWQQIALGEGETWEVFFQRSLAFAQKRLATRWMEQRGYWAPPAAQGGVLARSRSRRQRRPHAALSLSRLIDFQDELDKSSEARVADPRDYFSAAELVDLREMVLRLPLRQRMVIVMRYWQGALEDEIAEAVGVTSRTVRNDLGRAHKQLRAWYAGAEEQGEP